MHFTTRKQTKRQLAGFTLVELLVVIAIVAALAALVFSVTTRALLKGRQTSCLNLMRNVEVGLEAYMMEHNRPPLPETKRNWIRFWAIPEASTPPHLLLPFSLAVKIYCGKRTTVTPLIWITSTPNASSTWNSTLSLHLVKLGYVMMASCMTHGDVSS